MDTWLKLTTQASVTQEETEKLSMDMKVSTTHQPETDLEAKQRRQAERKPEIRDKGSLLPSRTPQLPPLKTLFL